MIHLLSSKSGHRSLGQAAVAVAGVFLATGATFAVSPSALADGPSAASPSAVEAGLKVKPVRAEIVMLVDISFSMSATQNDLYPQIPGDLHGVLQTLAKQEPQDTVAVIEFSASPQQIYDGPPEANIANELPTNPADVGTDIGAAFNQAIGTLRRDVQLKGVQVGSVLLLSDGELYTPGGSDYVPYGVPGWSQLRTEMSRLPIKVTGYGLQLPTDTTYDNELPTALSEVFGSPANVAKNTTELTRDLEMPGQQLLDSEIASAAAQDSGKDVQVAWSGLPGSNGSGPLNLTSAGNMDAEVTLTATTRRVPLYLTGLSVESSGLSGSLSGTLPASDQMLFPGRPVTLPVHLTWQPRPSGVSFRGKPQTKYGRLVLVGHVSSAYTPTIKNYFGDASFSAGGLAGTSSAPFAAVTPVFWNLSFILIILAIILLILAIIAFFRLRMRLAGTFTLTSVDDSSGMIPLSEWRWRRFVSTDEVIGIRGRMTVRGHLFGKGMKIGLQLENRPESELELAPGGRTMIAGIDIVHDTNHHGVPTGSRWR
jgi:Mg-chelatase subunit ChlD